MKSGHTGTGQAGCLSARRAQTAMARYKRIRQVRSLAAETGRTVAAYHWGHVEVSRTRKFEAVAVALDGITIDLLA